MWGLFKNQKMQITYRVIYDWKGMRLKTQNVRYSNLLGDLSTTKI